MSTQSIMVIMRCAISLLVIAVETIAFTATRTALAEKEKFLESLHYEFQLNDATRHRTQLLNEMITNKKEVDIERVLESCYDGGDENDNLSAISPASLRSILKVAEGTWKVIYAPHMATITNLVGGVDLDVEYIMHVDQKIESHAKFSSIPFLKNKSIYLSVSGNYGSESDDVCYVEWTEAWIRIVTNSSEEEEEDAPYPTFEAVPETPWKQPIADLGKLMFIRPFSVFPVSFLSHDITVFDFELLGTRICARKIPS